jgi:hypothetical protein
MAQYYRWATVLSALQYCRRATVFPQCYSTPCATAPPPRCAIVLRGATTHALFTPPSSPSVVMSSDIVALPTADAKVLKQRLNALVNAIKAIEEKAATMRRCVLDAHQLLDEEQAAAADLERQAATKKLVPGSTSFSTTETATAFTSYIDTIVANLHI